MNCRSYISLVVKVIHNDIFEDMGEVSENGHASGCEISVSCFGADESAKLFNVNIRTDASTYQQALDITRELSPGTIHYIKGVFFIDSNECYDLIMIFHPSYEPISDDEVMFYSELFDKYKNRVRIYRYEAVNDNDSCINLLQ